MMANVAFLGLGAMGARMAANLIGAGHSLTVWNRDVAKAAPLARAGARVAATPREAAGGADFVIAMLRDDEASRVVWTDPQTGALAGMKDDAIAIECSTLSLAHTSWLTREVTSRKLAFIDAPLAGSLPQAEAKVLIFFAGAATDDLGRADPILKAMGAAVHHAGAAGAGMAVKLAVNTLFAAQVAVMAELTEMLGKAGLDAGEALAIIGATPVCSPAAKVAGEMMVKDAFTKMFPVELVAKDLRYATEAAGGGGIAPVTDMVRARYEETNRQGFGNEHLTAVVKTLR
ncbi:MAG: NAD(P)-dependent oxidoreductase [Rhodobiaceae bacterium]|nr:NAD(P)-dependent oxidoreductase [Rhodobiaceae bacterium]MCC0051772.1 NAD(P)-dependent oxidoreductase [Rhodobiaceae bacterium]MCC0060433.1 NAD(P)-dependent oxidoreductase [Rhodobiaceae bacterium]